MTDINIGAITESLNYKSDLDLGNTSSQLVDYIIDQQLPTAENNYTWYRLYKSGWIEQGGKITSSPGTGTTLKVNFLIKMSEVLEVGGFPNANYGAFNESWATIGSISNTGISIALNAINDSGQIIHSYTKNANMSWFVYGKADLT